MESNYIDELVRVAEMELTYRTTIKASQRPAIRSSMDAYKIFLHSWDKGKIELVEQFKVLCLNRAFKVLGIYTVSSGSMCDTLVDIRQIFAPSLLGNASSIMIAHNHPPEKLSQVVMTGTQQTI